MKEKKFRISMSIAHNYGCIYNRTVMSFTSSDLIIE